MITREDIQATCDDIVREFAPLQVILFGSYAYGTPTEDSDVDLLVVMDTPEAETRRCDTEIRRRIPSRFPITRTHDLGKLLDLITPTLPDWHTWRSDVSKLSKV